LLEMHKQQLPSAEMWCTLGELPPRKPILFRLHFRNKKYIFIQEQVPNQNNYYTMKRCGNFFLDSSERMLIGVRVKTKTDNQHMCIRINERLCQTNQILLYVVHPSMSRTSDRYASF
ncbi:hypothetical protein L9F63_001040, partial [Diploptera punctata]